MNNPNPAVAPQGGPKPGRRRGLLILAAVVLVGGLAYGAWWFLVARNFESTDDAYVNGDVVQVTSEVPGTVLALHVDDTQAVKRGDVLAELDPADAQVSMSSAEAELARAVRSVRGLFAQGAQARAQIADREAVLSRANDDLRRRQGLVAQGAVSGEELSHSHDAITQAKAALDASREQLTQTLAQVEGTSVENHPQVLAAAAQVRNAALALHRTRLLAPVDGVIAKRSVQVGQRVAAGSPLMAVVPLNDVWIDANFKEVQLSRMRVGQPVTIHADLYGGDVTFHGKVAGLAAGSGSAFALLPAQNASGNWIKIVQRLPVRILLDPQELKDSPLRVGLSTAVKVDVHDAAGNQVAGVVRTAPQPVQASDGNDPEVEARIAKIIGDNAGALAAAREPAPVSTAPAAVGTPSGASSSRNVAPARWASRDHAPGLRLATALGARGLLSRPAALTLAARP